MIFRLHLYRGLILIALLTGSSFLTEAGSASERVLHVARASLEANLERVGEKTYLTAGRNQFRSLWSRDFAWSARGLLAIDRAEVERDQIEALLAHRRADGLVPRTLDSIPAQRRVLKHVLARVFPWIRTDIPIEADLEPEFLSENGTEAIDSNLLVVNAALDTLDRTGDRAWWDANKSALLEVFRWYDARLENGLITQPAFSDWQDSVRREGRTFYTNLLYFVVSKRLLAFPSFGVTEEALNETRARIEETFRDPETGLYRSVEGMPQISLDGVLLALDLGYLEEGSPEAAALFESLTRHPLWVGRTVPGFVTYPDYPGIEISLPVHFVGLRHYHDRLHWSWLMGLSLKIARRFGDEATTARLLSVLEKAFETESVAEIYFPKNPTRPWRSAFLEAEAPFSWGAAFIVDALKLAPPG